MSDTQTAAPPLRSPWRRRIIMLAGVLGLALIVWEIFALSPEVRSLCVEGLGQVQAYGLAYSFLNDSAESVRVTAHEVIAEGGAHAVPTLVKGLAQGENEHRRRDIALLQRMGANASAAQPTLLDLARNDPDADTRRIAVIALNDVAPDDAQVRITFIKALEDSAPGVREAAADVLGKQGNKAMEAIPALVIALRDPVPEVRRNSAEALGSIGPDLRSVQALALALQDPIIHVRAEAAESLGGFGPQAKNAVPALAKALKDSHPHMRQEAAEALGKIGPSARSAIPDLLAVAEDPDEDVRQEVKYALHAIGK